MNHLIKYLKCFLLFTPVSVIACNAQSTSEKSNSVNEGIITTTSSADTNTNAKKQIVLYMTEHDLWGLEKSSKTDAQYYRILIKELPKNKYLVQDFYISGNKLTDPYILTDGKLYYTDNEDVTHPNNYSPREGSRVVWFNSGEKKTESYYKDNLPSGVWIEYFKNGQKKNEDFYNSGVLDGVSRTWNQDGILTGECHYSAGKQNGRCYSKHDIHTDTYIYDGEFKNGKKVGIWKQWNLDGSVEKIVHYESITMDLLQKSFSNNQFKNFIFDVNADNIKDIIVSRVNNNSNIYQGDELYIYIGNVNGQYKLNLDTTNFTSDGGYHLRSILPRNDSLGLIIGTYFPDRGNSNIDYYVSYRANQWLLEKVSFHGNLNNPEVQSYYCVINQNINLTDEDFTIADGLLESGDDVLKQKCPAPPVKYKVKTEKAEILDEDFNSYTPPNYHIKNDVIKAIEQNDDWVKISYKNNTKTGWIDKRQLIAIKE